MPAPAPRRWQRPFSIAKDSAARPRSSGGKYKSCLGRNNRFTRDYEAMPVTQVSCRNYIQCPPRQQLLFGYGGPMTPAKVIEETIVLPREEQSRVLKFACSEK